MRPPFLFSEDLQAGLCDGCKMLPEIPRASSRAFKRLATHPPRYVYQFSVLTDPADQPSPHELPGLWAALGHRTLDGGRRQVPSRRCAGADPGRDMRLSSRIVAGPQRPMMWSLDKAVVFAFWNEPKHVWVEHFCWCAAGVGSVPPVLPNHTIRALAGEEVVLLFVHFGLDSWKMMEKVRYTGLFRKSNVSIHVDVI